MDEEVKKDIIINVQTNYDEALAQLVKYRKEVEYLSNEKKRYKEMLDAEMISQDEYVKAIAETTAEQKNASASAASWEKVVRNSLKADKEKEGSMQQMKAQLSNLTQAYNNLSKAERQSAQGIELQTKIKSLSDELKGGEESLGMFNRNVGNYKQAILDATASTGTFGGVISKLASGFGGATGAASGLNTQMLGLAVNPVVAVIGVLASVIALIAKTIKSSEEATNRWNVVLAPLKRIMDGLLSVLQQAVGELLSFVEAGAKMLDWAMKMGERLPIIGEQLKEVNAQNREAIALAKEKADIDKQARANELLNAKDALRVAELRKQAKDKENNTAKERLAAVKEANRIEEGASKRNVALAERRLKVLQIESSWAENNKETNDELARLEADVYNARREYFAKTMELLEQENTAHNEIAAEQKARADAQKKQAADAAKLVEDTEGLLRDIYRETGQANDDAFDAALKAETERVTKVLEMETEARKVAAQEFALEWENRLLAVEEGTKAESDLRTKAAQADYDRLVNMDAATKAALYDSDAAYTNALLKSKRELNKATDEANQKEQEAMVIKLQAARAIGEGFQNIFDAIGESSNELALAAKAIALFNIGLATAEAIAKGVASAQSVPFPGNLAAIATTVGAVLSNIAAAYKIINGLGNDPSSTTQQGGGNNGTSSKVVSATSSTSPSAVGYNAGTVPYQAATTGLYSAAATDTVNSQLNDVNLSTQAINLLKNAISSLPRPVVDVRQISDMQNKVEVVEQTRRLG